MIYTFGQAPLSSSPSSAMCATRYQHIQSCSAAAGRCTRHRCLCSSTKPERRAPQPPRRRASFFDMPDEPPSNFLCFPLCHGAAVRGVTAPSAGPFLSSPPLAILPTSYLLLNPTRCSPPVSLSPPPLSLSLVSIVPLHNPSAPVRLPNYEPSGPPAGVAPIPQPFHASAATACRRPRRPRLPPRAPRPRPGRAPLYCPGRFFATPLALPRVPRLGPVCTATPTPSSSAQQAGPSLRHPHGSCGLARLHHHQRTHLSPRNPYPRPATPHPSPPPLFIPAHPPTSTAVTPFRHRPAAPSQTSTKT